MSTPALLPCIALTLLTALEARAQEQYLVLNSIPGERYNSAFAQIQQLPTRTSSGHLRLASAMRHTAGLPPGASGQMNTGALM